jgi:hypothetical protein
MTCAKPCQSHYWSKFGRRFWNPLLSLAANMTSPRSPQNKNKVKQPIDNTQSATQDPETWKVQEDTHIPSNIIEHPKHSTPYNKSSSVVRETPYPPPFQYTSSFKSKLTPMICAINAIQSRVMLAAGGTMQLQNMTMRWVVDQMKP